MSESSQDVGKSDGELEEATRLLELALRRTLDDFADQYDTMVVSIAVRWTERGDGVLRHSVSVKTGR